MKPTGGGCVDLRGQSLLWAIGRRAAVRGRPRQSLGEACCDFSQTKSDRVVRTCPKTHRRCVTDRYHNFPESELCSHPRELKAKTCSGEHGV